MKNITITVPESVAKWARVWAARNESSVSKLVGELLTTKMKEESAYEAAKKRYLNKPPQKLGRTGSRYPRRSDLHDR